MFDKPETVAALFFALVGIAEGILFRLGFLRRVGRWYFDPELPVFIRNLPFMALPGGLAMLMLFSLFVLEDQRLGAVSSPLQAVALVSFEILLVTALVWLFRPPRFLKPEWLRAEEERRRTG